MGSWLDPAAKADQKMRISQARYVVVDTELTGLDGSKDSIVSIGAIRMAGGRINLGESFYRLVKPATAITAASVVVHEITPSDVAREPAIDAVLDEFLEFCGDDIIVGYCVAIDLEFIGRELKRLHRTALGNSVLDIRSLYEHVRRRLPSLDGLAKLPDNARLHEIAAGFDIPINGAHHAEMDAFITAQLFQKFLHLLPQTGIARLGELLRAGDPSRHYDVFDSAREVYNL